MNIHAPLMREGRYKPGLHTHSESALCPWSYALTPLTVLGKLYHLAGRDYSGCLHPNTAAR